MGSRCWGCGEKLGRCYAHGEDCPSSCANAKHECRGYDHWYEVEDSERFDD